ncbi:DNA translocase FtsK [Mangrovicoccus sp. HB161399]|uniref:DNA translocase FtsK n=1 Tax=Mangrovicoccus sp. HB161399 TaxID=2720392 RepID=UPI001552FAD1|nr:DNA translocase FtsK [Mangrovicoccus sp. HB161399]
MAYSTRGRDPLLDAETQAALERRTSELIGLALIAGAVGLGLILASYSPYDPSFLGSTTGDPQNLLGYPGAYVASALSFIFGRGAWALVVALGIWGGRFLFHRGGDRLLSRGVFLPLWVALAAIYASSYVPGPEWTHHFGLGGMLGDAALGILIGILPLGLGLSLKISAVLLGLGVLAFGLFCTGFTRAELGGLGRFLGIGTVLAYDKLLRRAGEAGQGAAAGMSEARARRAEAREERRAVKAERKAAARAEPKSSRRAVLPDDDDIPVLDEDEDWTRDPLFQTAAERAAYGGEAYEDDGADGRWDAEEPDGDGYDDGYGDDDGGYEEPRPAKASFLSRIPVIGPRIAPEPAPEPYDMYDDEDEELSDEADDRLQARITGAIRRRQRQDRAQLAAKRRRGKAPAAAPEPEPESGEEAGSPAMFIRPRRAEPPVAGRQMPRFEEVADDMDDEDDFAPAPAATATEIPRFLAQKAVVRQPVQAPPKPSARVRAEAQPDFLGVPEEGYAPPPLALLTDPSTVEKHYLSDEALQENARMLETVLDDYGVKGDIVSVRPGPVVTMYELEPAPGLKASRVIGLADDIARSMSALSARVSTVPGRTVIGIELPNEHREMVLLREILASTDFDDGKARLPLALGKDIGGRPIVANLAKMPHLLIAGTTGSGKSVAINTMILSLLYKLSPEECRLIMIDPKMLELSVYDGIPHLLSPVVTDPKKAVVALKWVVGEMEDRYRKMSKMGVRNIEGYNGRVADALAKGELFSRTVQTGFDDETGDPVFETEEIQPVKLPFIVVIVDEMADLMMVAGKEIEACIQRLAQMARASGIHIIMATQRPSVDVITGTIKANFPTRISFQVTSKVDSRTILGEMGAEQLLGMGDMLYMAGGAKITRVHGPFASDEEVEEVVTYLKAYGPPEYVNTVLEGPDDEAAPDIDAVLGLGGNTTGEDALYDKAVQIVIKDRKCSTSYIQRKLGIGYNKAARLVEQMEEEGLVSQANHVGKREILVPEQ